MLRWLMAIIASAFTFALADVLCDVCITESEADAQTVESAVDDEDAECSGVEMSSVSSSAAGSSMSRQGSGGFSADALQQQTPLVPRYKALAPPSSKALDDIGHDDQHHGHEEAGLTGAQDAAIAGLVTAKA